MARFNAKHQCNDRRTGQTNRKQVDNSIALCTAVLTRDKSTDMGRSVNRKTEPMSDIFKNRYRKPIPTQNTDTDP